MFRYVARLVLALTVALSAYLAVYRPLQLRLGATRHEVNRAMPGDEIQPWPIFNATRAVTINANPAQVWPWLVQIGYKRAGWYGYDIVDNARIPSAERILPEWQHIQVGDTVPIWEGINFRVAAFEPNRYVVWQSASGHDSMVLALYPVDEAHTRLVWRIHNAPYLWGSGYIVAQLFADMTDVIAVRENLQGIKRRAEGAALGSPAMLYVELALWLAAFLGFLVAEVGLVVRRDWVRPMLAVPATALITIGLVLIRPPIWVDAMATAAISIGLWWMSQGQAPVTASANPARRFPGSRYSES
ncbi:MAG: hypothetical protein ACLQVL_04910 [Terriglobia bacterium]